MHKMLAETKSSGPKFLGPKCHKSCPGSRSGPNVPDGLDHGQDWMAWKEYIVMDLSVFPDSYAYLTPTLALRHPHFL